MIGRPCRTAAWTWAKFSRPGRIGRPAASAEVHPAGRSAFDLRCQIAPDPAVEPRGRVAGFPQLVERAGPGVDHDGVAVAAGVPAALDGGVRAERIGPAVALRRVGELDPDQPVPVGHDPVRDAVRVTAGIGPEVGVQVGAAGVHAGQPGRAVRVDRQPGDVGVPHVTGREQRAVGGAGHGGPGRGDRHRGGGRGRGHGHRQADRAAGACGQHCPGQYLSGPAAAGAPPWARPTAASAATAVPASTSRAGCIRSRRTLASWHADAGRAPHRRISADWRARPAHPADA